MLDLIFGFLVKNYVCSQLETSRNPQYDEKIAKNSFEQNNLISGLVFVFPMFSLLVEEIMYISLQIRNLREFPP